MSARSVALVAFEVDRVSGSGGCTRYGGPYTYVDGVLTFGEMPKTVEMQSAPPGI